MPSLVEQLIGSETSSFTVVAGYARGGLGLSGNPVEDEKPPKPNKLTIVLIPKVLTYNYGIINELTGTPTPDGIVRIEGEPKSVLLALKELITK